MTEVPVRVRGPSFGITRWLLPALLAGRAASRLAIQAGPLLLLAAWGPATFGEYADAVGTAVWVVFLAASGEKTVLKLVPRVRRIRGEVIRVVLLTAVLPLVVAAVLVAVTGSLLSLALLWSAGLGLLQLVAAAHRANSRPAWDVVGFVGLAGVVGLGVAFAAALAWSPYGFLLFVCAGVIALAVLLLLRLPREWLLGPSSGHGVARRVLRACLLLGTPELLLSASVAVCYVALSLSGNREDSGRFYAAVAVSGICSAGLVYALRLWQPATSVRLRSVAGRVGRAQAARLLSVGLAAIGLLMGLVLVSGLLGLSGNWLLVACTAVEVLAFAVVTWAGYLIENTDGRAPRITAAAGLVGLLVAVALASLLVPRIGPAGAMASIVLALMASAATMRVGVRG